MTRARIAYAAALALAERLGVTMTVKRTSWRWRLLGRLPFMRRDFGTTIGPWIGLPDDWDERSDLEKACLLRHELTHVEQHRWLGFGSAIAAIVPFALAYLLLPLPFGLAWCRYRFELAAFRAAMALRRELGGDVAGESLRVAGLLGGRTYGWAWPWRRIVRAMGG